MDSCVEERAENEKLYDEIRRMCNNPDQFAGLNHIAVTVIAEDYAEGELTVTAQSCNVYNIVHGGCLAALADTVAGSAVASRGRNCVTINYGMNFLSPATGTKIKCVARPRKVGKTICVYHCLLTDDKGRTVAAGDFTFMVFGDNRITIP